MRRSARAILALGFVWGNSGSDGHEWTWTDVICWLGPGVVSWNCLVTATKGRLSGREGASEEHKSNCGERVQNSGASNKEEERKRHDATQIKDKSKTCFRPRASRPLDLPSFHHAPTTSQPFSL
ncbi:hypothetical protein CLAIMM_08855 isoform 2 [Cladophialophora immunda]|nr:hypothetical protein CLAIMM_08855 isoform 1 [Cladophialophora immunda]OQV03870.1 hypothetical protein CLAIMM_08855 isoform 2 [Cladophialophora immunda]